jgi:two-component system, LytTR family, response regulator
MQNRIGSIIVDDEPGNIITLQELLKAYCPGVLVEGTAQDPIQGYNLIQEVKPELVFLDIEMPYGNAFDLLDKLLPISFEVIFITAFNDYAIKAFKYAALDYLLKPVNIEELKAAVNRAEERLRHKNVNGRINLLLDNMRSESTGLQKIGLPTTEGLLFEDIDTITHLEADGSYTKVFINGGKPLLVSKNLKEYEDILPPALFCRVHHSHIVNLRYVKKYYKGRGGYIELQDGTSIEVSARKKDEFFDRFMH